MKNDDLDTPASRSWIHSPRKLRPPSNLFSEGIPGGGVVADKKKPSPRLSSLFWAKAVFVTGAVGLGGVVIVAIFF